MNTMISRLALAAILGVSGAVAASAHTVSYGYVAGASPGEVEFWFGSYHANGGSLAGIPFESQMVLQGEGGTSYGPQIFTPTLKSLTLPTGLVLGDNYTCNASFAASYTSCDTATGSTLPVVSWMGVVATGLNAGDYSFQLQDAANTTAFWSVWDQTIGAPFTLESGDIGGGGTDPDSPSEVPLPAGLPLLLGGLGMFGLASKRRKARA